MATPAASELLARAARCYRNAGHADDACRCLERAGDHAAAALLHEQNGRHRAAAACFERAQSWGAAARCHQRAGDMDDAIRCLETAGRPLEAAWLLAHHARRPDRALALAAHPPAAMPGDSAAVALIRARCHAARRPAEAAALLRGSRGAIAGLPSGPDRERLIGWSLAVAGLLDRPDLITDLFAALAGSDPETIGDWETWARTRLASADGIFAATNHAPDHTSDDITAAAKGAA